MNFNRRLRTRIWGHVDCKIASEIRNQIDTNLQQKPLANKVLALMNQDLGDQVINNFEYT